MAEKTQDTLDDLLAQFEQDPFDWDEREQDGGGPTKTVLEFGIGAQRYALLGDVIQEVIPLEELTHLPGAPPYIDGVMIYRRQVVGILNVQAWLSARDAVIAPSRDEPARAVLVEHDGYLVGLRINATDTQLQQWPAQLIDRPVVPSELPAPVKPYVKTVRVTPSRQSVILLDLGPLLDDTAVQD